MKNELLRLSADRFVALILDNEVTVSEFVATPPLSWSRLIQRNGVFQVTEGYPNLLTAAQAKFEMKNWDTVSLPDIARALRELDDAADYVVFGNNAGQGAAVGAILSATFDRQSRSDHLCEQLAGEKRLRETRLSGFLSEE